MFCGLSGSCPTNRNIAFKVCRGFVGGCGYFVGSLSGVVSLIYKELSGVSGVSVVLVNLVYK